jgi:hypothetical protein
MVEHNEAPTATSGNEPNTHAVIGRHIAALNRKLGHTRGTPRVTRESATVAQLPFVEALEAWYEARQYRLNLDGACARARIAEDAAKITA